MLNIQMRAIFIIFYFHESLLKWVSVILHICAAFWKRRDAGNKEEVVTPEWKVLSLNPDPCSLSLCSK